MKSELLQEIDDLKDQIQHFEAAIAALKKPGETPTGNALADVLLARFEKMDSDKEKEKSLKTAQTLLSEVRGKLEAKEAYLKRIRGTLTARRSAMGETGRQINRLSDELKILLEAIHGHELAVTQEWRTVAGNTQMVEWGGEITLPQFRQLTGDGAHYAIDSIELEFKK